MGSLSGRLISTFSLPLNQGCTVVMIRYDECAAGLHDRTVAGKATAPARPMYNPQYTFAYCFLRKIERRVCSSKVHKL